MKKIIKFIIAATAVFMMASCGDETKNLGKEVKLSKQEASEKIENAVKAMGEQSGLKIVDNSSLSIEMDNKIEKLPNNGETVVKHQKMELTAEEKTTFEFLMNLTGVEALLETKVNASMTLEASEEKVENKVDGTLGLYVTNSNVYGQIDATISSGEEEEKLDLNGYVALDEIITQLGDIIGSEGMLPEIDEATGEMLENLMVELESAISGPKAYEKGNDLTIVYSITMNDVNNILDPIADLFVQIISEPKEAILEQLQKIASEILTLNKFELQIKIHDEKMISDIKFNVDLAINDLLVESKSLVHTDPETGESFIDYEENDYLTMKVALNSHTQFEALSKDYKVSFPEGMLDWPKIELQ